MAGVKPGPFDPQHMCPKCGTEGARPHRHEKPVLIVFGSGPQWPCSGPDMAGQLGEHLCNRCEVCGYAWMEAVSEGMDEPPAP